MTDKAARQKAIASAVKHVRLAKIGARVKVKVTGGWPRRGYFVGKVVGGPLWEVTDGFGNAHYVEVDQLLPPPPLKKP